MKVQPSIYVSDTATVRRSWKERLFSRPWNPLKKYKSVSDPKAYMYGATALCSFETYAKIKKAELSLDDIEKEFWEFNSK